MSKIQPQLPEPVLLNKSDMAKSLQISTQAFDKWGVAPTERRGREALFSVADVVANRIANERKKQSSEPLDGDGPNLDFERYRLLKAQADAQELKNERSKQLVVPTEFASFALSGIAAQISSVLDQLPLTLKRKFPELEQHMIDAVKGEIIKAQNVCAWLSENIESMLDDFIAESDQAAEG